VRNLIGQRGVAMVIALFALVLVAGIGTLLFTRTVNEIQHSADDAAIVQTLLLARGGSNVAGALLRNDISQMLDLAVRYTSSPGRWAYGSGAGDVPNATDVMNGLNSVITRLQPAVDQLLCENPIVPSDTGAEIQLRMYFASTACGEALPSDVRLPAPRFVSGSPRNADGIGQQTYALPFVLVSEATLGEYRRNIVTQGEYQFDIGKTPFSMWAYFTNREVSRDINGNWVDKIYFTDQSMIDGPTHTNGHFAFAYDPWFGGTVSSAGCNDANCTSIDRGAYLYNYTHTIEENCRWETSYRYVQQNGGDYVRVWSGGRWVYRLWRSSDGRNVTRYRQIEERNWVCDTREVELVPDTALGDSPNYGGNAPMFTGVTWDSPHIALPDNNINQRNVAAGLNRADEGLLFESSLYRLEVFAGTDANWNGNVSSVTPTWRNNRWERQVGGRWVEADLVYQYVRACTTENQNSCSVYRFNSAGLVEEYRNGSWTPRASGKPFNGVIYADGEVQRFTGPTRTNSSNSDTAAPALAPFAQITLASNSDIRITGDLKYADAVCSSTPTRNADRSGNAAQCDNLAAANVLGVYTQGGNILVGHGHGNNSGLNAPDNVVVNAVLMSAEHEIKVENYNSGDSGAFYLTGGMIQERRGIFGTFSGKGANANRTGYDRVYTYDPRMGRGMAPPFFPATTMDNVASVRPFTFGQREQLYD